MVLSTYCLLSYFMSPRPSQPSAIVSADGADERARRHPQDHLECGKAWKATSADPALLQGRRQVLASHAEER